LHKSSGWPLLGHRKRLKWGKFLVSEKLFLSQVTTGPNALIYGRKQPWDKGIPICINKIPGVINKK